MIKFPKRVIHALLVSAVSFLTIAIFLTPSGSRHGSHMNQLPTQPPTPITAAPTEEVSGPTDFPDATAVSADSESEIAYIGNKNTGVFHVLTCKSVSQMSEKNKVPLKDRDAALEAGFHPCHNCNP